MLTEKQIKYNEDKFKELLQSITVEDADIEGLIKYLNESDFFYAPATVRYAGSYDGGLCEYCLRVYYNLSRLAKGFCFKWEKKTRQAVSESGEPKFNEDKNPVMEEYWDRIPVYSDDTIKIVGLLHALAKVDFYKAYNRNVKNDSGEWEQVKEYTVRDASERSTYGSKAINSLFRVSHYIPLSEEETMAILNQSAGMDKDEVPEDVLIVLAKSPLTVCLHNAIMSALYIPVPEKHE